MTQPFELGSKLKRFSLVKRNLISIPIFFLIIGGTILTLILLTPSSSPSPSIQSFLIGYLLVTGLFLIGFYFLYQCYKLLWVDMYQGGLIKAHLFGQREVLLWREVAEVELTKYLTAVHARRTYYEKMNIFFSFLTYDERTFNFSVLGIAEELRVMLIEHLTPHLLPNTLKELDQGKEMFLHELLGYDSSGVVFYPAMQTENQSNPKGKYISWSDLKAGFEDDQIFILAEGIPFLELPVTETVNYFIFLEVAKRNNVKIEERRHRVV